MRVFNKGGLTPLEKQELHKSNCIPASCGYITSRRRTEEPVSELWVVLRLFWSFVWYSCPGSLLAYFHLCDSAWAAIDPSDVLMQIKKPAAARLDLINKIAFLHLPGTLFVYPIIPPVRNHIWCSNQPAAVTVDAPSGCRSALAVLNSKIKDDPFHIRSDAISIKPAPPHISSHFPLVYGCTKHRIGPLTKGSKHF